MVPAAAPHAAIRTNSRLVISAPSRAIIGGRGGKSTVDVPAAPEDKPSCTAAGPALIGMAFLGESRDVPRILCIVLIVAGVVGLRLASASGH